MRIASCMLAASVALSSLTVQAYSTGITGRSSAPGTSTCSACHSGGSYSYNTATVTGSTSVAGSSVNAYTLNFTKASGATAAAAGFNLSATGGSLSDPDTGDNSVRRAGNELTHGEPRDFDVNGDFSWSFNWTAPASSGTYTFYFCNNPVNLSGTNAGDGTIRCGNVTITVTPPPPTPPVANDDSYATPPDTTRTVPAPGVLVNDTDVNGDTLTVVPGSGPANGTLSLGSDGAFTYTPNAAFTGVDSFTYQASDDGGATTSNTATVTITVAANAVPVANGDAYNANEDTPRSVAAPGVLANDTDADGQSLSAILVGNPVNGSVTLNANGSFIYTPNADFSGSDSFTYQASDGLENSGVATVAISVAATPSSGGGGGGGGGGTPAPMLLSLFALAAYLRGLNASKRRAISP